MILFYGISFLVYIKAAVIHWLGKVPVLLTFFDILCTIRTFSCHGEAHIVHIINRSIKIIWQKIRILRSKPLQS